MSDVKTIKEFKGSAELYEEVASHGFHSIVAGKPGAYWAVVLADTPSAVVVMASVGGDMGKSSPAIALREALAKAIECKPELDHPENWVQKD